MSAQALLNICESKEQRAKLLELVEKRLEIAQSIESYKDDIESYKDDLTDIDTNALSLGLKKTEFNTIFRWFRQDEELIFNELTFLQAIAQLKESN